MTYTKRQWFIYRLKQSVLMLSKLCKYIDVVNNYVKGSKYSKEIKKITKSINDCYSRLNRFLDKVNSSEVE